MSLTRQTIKISKAIIPFLPLSGLWKKASTTRTSTAVKRTMKVFVDVIAYVRRLHSHTAN